MNKNGMNSRAKSKIFHSATLLVVAALIAPSVHTASFDCTSATSKAEKFICEHEDISKLDADLAKTYHAVSNKLDTAGKQKLIAEQRHWLTHTRVACRNETCFKLAYWSRQSELATYFEPKSSLYAKESDKAETIKKVLATAKLYRGWTGDLPQCDELLSDLKQMKGIRFVDPVAQAMSYEDPVLDPWKKNCGGKPPLHFSWACEPRLIAIDPSEIENALDGQCDGGFGLPPFKIFELPPFNASSKPIYLFYSDNSYGPVSKEVTRPRVAGAGHIGFTEFDLGRCTPVWMGRHVQAIVGLRDGPNYNSVIEYQHRYFVMVLEHKLNSYWLDVKATDRNESCWWTPVEK